MQFIQKIIFVVEPKGGWCILPSFFKFYIMLDVPFMLSDCGKKIIFPKDFVYSEEINYASKMIFETPLAKSYISQFKNGKKKNIHVANVFKLCIILGCSPNDLFDWENWQEKLVKKLNDKNSKTTKDMFLVTNKEVH